jgi:hypothetical protein
MSDATATRIKASKSWPELRNLLTELADAGDGISVRASGLRIDPSIANFRLTACPETLQDMDAFHFVGDLKGYPQKPFVNATSFVNWLYKMPKKEAKTLAEPGTGYQYVLLVLGSEEIPLGTLLHEVAAATPTSPIEASREKSPGHAVSKGTGAAVATGLSKPATETKPDAASKSAAAPKNPATKPVANATKATPEPAKVVAMADAAKTADAAPRSDDPKPSKVNLPPPPSLSSSAVKLPPLVPKDSAPVVFADKKRPGDSSQETPPAKRLAEGDYDKLYKSLGVTFFNAFGLYFNIPPHKHTEFVKGVSELAGKLSADSNL